MVLGEGRKKEEWDASDGGDVRRSERGLDILVKGGDRRRSWRWWKDDDLKGWDSELERRGINSMFQSSERNYAVGKKGDFRSAVDNGYVAMGAKTVIALVL